MKKFFAILVALCLTFSVFAVAGCEQKCDTHDWDEGTVSGDEITYTCSVCGETKTEPKESCSFDSAWTTDADYHWHKCTDSDCTEISQKAEHTWGEGSLDNGIMTYTCSVCSKTKTENKAELYNSVSNSIADQMTNLDVSGGSQTSAPYKEVEVALLSGSVSGSVSGSIEDLYDVQTNTINVKGVVVFVKLLAELTENSSFNITDKPVKFTYSYNGAYTESGSATLMYKFDEVNNKVKMYWDVDSTMTMGTNEVSMNIFLYLDVDYDFATDTMEAFTLYQHSYAEMEVPVFGKQRMTMNLMSNIYEDGVLKGFMSSQANELMLEVVDGFEAEIIAKADVTINLNADFTAEYTAAMNIMNPSSGGSVQGGGSSQQGGSV